MKILVLSSFDEVCGIAAYTADLRRALIAAGHAVSVFPIDGPALDRLARTELLAHFEGFFGQIPDHDAVVIQHEYALYAGGHGYEAAFAVPDQIVKRAARAGKPILVTFHNDPPGTTRVPPAPREHGGRDGWQGLAATINRSAHVSALVHSPAARGRMIEAGIKAEKLTVHPVPVPAAPGAAALRTAAPEINLTIFGFVGHYKGYEVALRSLMLLPRHFRLTIAGGEHPRDNQKTTLPAIREFLESGFYPGGALPPLPPSTRAGVRDTLAGRVAITGFLPEDAVVRTLAATDIVLLPYTRHGPVQSGAASWALACRRPIVATAVDTFADLVAERPCMHLVPPDSPEALAAGIAHVADDESLRAALVREAGLYADEHSWRSAAQVVAARLAASRPPSPWRRALRLGHRLSPSLR